MKSVDQRSLSSYLTQLALEQVQPISFFLAQVNFQGSDIRLDFGLGITRNNGVHRIGLPKTRLGQFVACCTASRGELLGAAHALPIGIAGVAAQGVLAKLRPASCWLSLLKRPLRKPRANDDQVKSSSLLALYQARLSACCGPEIVTQSSPHGLSICSASEIWTRSRRAAYIILSCVVHGQLNACRLPIADTPGCDVPNIDGASQGRFVAMDRHGETSTYLRQACMRAGVSAISAARSIVTRLRLIMMTAFADNYHLIAIPTAQPFTVTSLRPPP